MKTAHPIRVNAKRGRDPAGGEWEAIDSGVGRGRVQILPSGTGPYSQAVLAVDELQRLSRLDEGWDWTKCAVLARNREFLHPVRALCVERGIPVHWQEAGDKAPPFHHIREVAAFLDVLKAVRRDIANAATILNKFDELHRAPAGNPWAESLQECLKGYLEDTNNQALPIEDCIEWIYEYGAERRRDTFTGLWLNTAHAAKGCEFDHVVVLDAGWVRQSNEVDSERRLYYVAMTRTRRTLTLCRMSGSATPFPTEALNSSGAFEREAPVAPTVPDSIRREFLTLGLGDVDLGYAGRTADDRIHAAIRALRPGDSLQLVASQGTQQLRNAKGVTIGRLAKNFRLPDKKVHAVTVSSIVRRTRDQVTDPKWLPAIKVDVWEVVVPEIVVG